MGGDGRIRAAGHEHSARPTVVAESGRLLRLDGLRAIAIGMVFLQHVHGVPLFWSGVDLFFVLSGYLITGILLRTRRQPNYFRNFYARRTLRIFPAYYIVLAVAVLVLPATRSMAGWAAGYAGNVWVALNTDHNALGHLWSLAVEEQFYLLWPLAILFCPVRRRWWLIGTAIVGAWIARGLSVGFGSWFAAYTLLPCRMDGLAIGAALALVEFNRGRHVLVAARRWLLPCALASGLLFVATARVFPWLSVGYGTVCLGLSVMFYGFLLAWVLSLSNNSPVVRILSWRPVTYVGQISYGLYLFHLPVIYWLGQWYAKGSVALILLASVLTLALSMVSWYLIEKPINRHKHRFQSAAVPAVPSSDDDATLERRPTDAAVSAFHDAIPRQHDGRAVSPQS